MFLTVLFAYGFRSNGPALLEFFIWANLVILLLGCLPRRFWQSPPHDDS